MWGNASQWEWNWQQHPAGSAVSYVSAPLASDTTVVGSGAVSLWVRSSTPDVDLMATISEVRPDGNEVFVQNGWIRVSERKLSTNSKNMFKRPSTVLEPVPTFTAADAAPMPADQFVKVVVPLYYEGHASPRRDAPPGHDLRAERHATDLGVQRDRAAGERRGLDRVLGDDAVEPRAPGRAGRERAGGPSALREPAQRAVPPVPGDGERRRLNFGRRVPKSCARGAGAGQCHP